jgi:hypothetical protein
VRANVRHAGTDAMPARWLAELNYPLLETELALAE